MLLSHSCQVSAAPAQQAGHHWHDLMISDPCSDCSDFLEKE